MTDPLLNPEELGSSAWAKIKKQLEKDLQAYREQNDAHKSPEETAMLRGRIMYIKKLLYIANKPELKSEEYIL